uniref:sialic acid-binding Ig-like lectin 12 isoform X3 n=1 Tax=Arvicanthis niloticus TaxID=61156 RepID=UPI0014871078|nr:sialic acid-binding Ig-like lectin 12 isoform X3 [Arvicanthis niloticus]
MLLTLLLPSFWVFKWASGNCFLLHREFRDGFPSLTLELQSVTVQEGLCILVPCTFTEYPIEMWSDSVFRYWFHEGENTDLDSLVATNNPNQLVQKETQSRFHLSKHCSLDIRDAQKGDSGSYFFGLENKGVKWNYCEDRIFVHVTDAAQNSTVHFSGRVGPGKPRPLAEVIQVAMGEAAIKFLLLGLCFFLLSLRSHRKRVERPATHKDHADTAMD